MLRDLREHPVAAVERGRDLDTEASQREGVDGNRARLDLVASVVPDEDPELETLTHLGWR